MREEEGLASGRPPLLPHGLSGSVRVHLQHCEGGRREGCRRQQPEEEEKVPPLLSCCVLLLLTVVATKVTCCVPLAYKTTVCWARTITETVDQLCLHLDHIRVYLEKTHYTLMHTVKFLSLSNVLFSLITALLLTRWICASNHICKVSNKDLTLYPFLLLVWKQTCKHVFLSWKAWWILVADMA